MALDPATTTLSQAKDWLRVRLDEGAKCPCCAQHAKLYKRNRNRLVGRKVEPRLCGDPDQLSPLTERSCLIGGDG